MIEIPLTQGKVALVDDIDADLLAFKWNAGRRQDYYYASRGVKINDKMKHIFMHRVILERMIGRPLTRNDFTDHIHGNTLDNRRSEIRLATRSQNQCNQPVDRANKTGYKGVHFRHDREKYMATIYVQRKQIHLGTFNTAEEAHAAYCQAAIKYHGEFANFGSFEPNPLTLVQLPLFNLDKVA